VTGRIDACGGCWGLLGQAWRTLCHAAHQDVGDDCALLVGRRLLGRLHVEVTDGPLDLLVTLALGTLGHAAIVLFDAHVLRELSAAPPAEELVVGHRGTSLSSPHLALAGFSKHFAAFIPRAATRGGMAAYWSCWRARPRCPEAPRTVSGIRTPTRARHDNRQISQADQVAPGGRDAEEIVSGKNDVGSGRGELVQRSWGADRCRHLAGLSERLGR